MNARAPFPHRRITAQCPLGTGHPTLTSRPGCWRAGEVTAGRHPRGSCKGDFAFSPVVGPAAERRDRERACAEGCPAVLGELTTPVSGWAPGQAFLAWAGWGRGETLLTPGSMAMYTTKRRARGSLKYPAALAVLMGPSAELNGTPGTGTSAYRLADLPGISDHTGKSLRAQTSPLEDPN